MKVRASAHLATDIDSAWELLHTPKVFREVSGPFTVFREDPLQPLPERFSSDTDYRVSVRALGIIPLGKQIIHLVDEVESWAQRRTTDRGRGLSGPLAALRDWNHEMTLEALDDGGTRFSDCLTARASWLTPLAWPALQVFWWWRKLRLRAVAKRTTSRSGTSWNERYASRNQMWSGEVNPVLAQVASSRPPGRALDLGCGEGADAIWLAEHGWRVHAIDASSVAVFRGHREVHRRHPHQPPSWNISWQVADLVSLELPEDATYDLVSLQFLHLDQGARAVVWQKARDAVAPGGSLLIVGHSIRDHEVGIRRPSKPLLFSLDTFESLSLDGWSTVRVEEVARRTSRGDSTVEVWDVVLLATR